MLFNSFEFLIFFPIVCYLYFLLPLKVQPYLLFVASCIFYMAFMPAYVLILIFIIVIDFYAAKLIENSHGSTRKRFLQLSLAANLILLAIFKYYAFILGNINFLFAFSGQAALFPYYEFILPIGLSFHTFQAMSYTIEVYRGNYKAENSILHYGLYVMFFPQLVAGPIERPQNLIAQLKKYHQFDYQRVTSGLRLMLLGFTKKVLIADRLALLVDQVYANPTQYSGGSLLLATYFFSIQIYCDFSGYTDIARGAARVLGIDLMKNFERPYLSSSLIEFWRRWHISLSSWFRDYVYIPLGGNKVSLARWILNILVVFGLSGLWHGAQWTFVVWGFLHGFFVICNQIFRSNFPGRSDHNLMKVIKIFFTFNLVSLLWIFFRAESINDAIYIFAHLFDFTSSIDFRRLGLNIFEIVIAIGAITLLFLLEKFGGSEDQLESKFLKLSEGKRIAIYYSLTLCLIMLGKLSRQQFIYFQF